jgi:hypothetical protein
MAVSHLICPTGIKGINRISCQRNYGTHGTQKNSRSLFPTAARKERRTIGIQNNYCSVGLVYLTGISAGQMGLNSYHPNVRWVVREKAKALFGTRVLVGISRDNPLE